MQSEWAADREKLEKVGPAGAGMFSRESRELSLGSERYCMSWTGNI